jgi:hypothetical protein
MLLGGNDLNLVETAEFLALYDIPQATSSVEAVSMIVDATKLVLIVRTIEV